MESQNVERSNWENVGIVDVERVGYGKGDEEFGEAFTCSRAFEVLMRILLFANEELRRLCAPCFSTAHNWGASANGVLGPCITGGHMRTVFLARA